MSKQLIEYIQNIAKQHKAVNYTSYKQQIDINHQNNYRYFQFNIDDEVLLEKQLVEGILTARLNIDVLGFVTPDSTPLIIQDTALHIMLDVIEYINNDNFVEVRDYSIVSFSNYTDDNCSGIRTSLTLVIPSPINICEYKDNFIEKEEETEDELELIPDNECCEYKQMNNNLILNPIKLF